MEKKTPLKGPFFQIGARMGLAPGEKIGPAGSSPGKKIGPVDSPPGKMNWDHRFVLRGGALALVHMGGEKIHRKYVSKSNFPFDRSCFPLTQDFLSRAVRCGALALVPMDGEKIHRNYVSKSNFPFDRSNFPLTQDFLSRAVRCGAFAFVPGFFFHPRVNFFIRAKYLVRLL